MVFEGPHLILKGVKSSEIKGGGGGKKYWWTGCKQNEGRGDGDVYPHCFLSISSLCECG